MTTSSPVKKPRLDTEGGGDGGDNHDGVVQIVAAAGCVSAVTVLASVVLTDETMMIFSGHRDGTIRRWDTTSDDKQQQKQQEAVWTISACTDLTQHDLYGQQERLGIAGLAVRKQPDSQQQHDGNTNAPVLLQLYSWNHQREDMREINGIPQKIMIWQCTTGERCSALMVDVGRSTAGTFANPLVSCIVFCKLLVEQQPKPQPQPTMAEDTTTSTTATVEKVWIDTVLVGLLATCDPSPPPEMDADVVAVGGDVADAAVAAAVPPGLPQQQAKRKPAAAATGNLVPFREHSRQRMTPWIVPGGFVRALVTVPDKYVISVTETTTTTTNTARNESTPVVGRPTTSAAAADEEGPNTTNNATVKKASNGSGGDAGTPTNQNDATTALVAKEEGGGESHAITLWDITQPGAVLHILKLYDFTTMECTSSLRGSVCGIALSENLLLLSFAATGGGNNGLLGVVDLSQRSNADEKDDVRRPESVGLGRHQRTISVPSAAGFRHARVGCEHRRPDVYPQRPRLHGDRGGARGVHGARRREPG